MNLIGKRVFFNTIHVAATIFAATLVFSCSDKVKKSTLKILPNTPLQVIENMVLKQSEDGNSRMVVKAPKWESFGGATPYDLFPNGVIFNGYKTGDTLETEITADIAKHIKGNGEDRWIAFGNVVITNYIKNEVLKTDTIYWDTKTKKIYTHCLVKMTTPDMFIQGYGMESDEMARNAKILNPFDSYAIVKK